MQIGKRAEGLLENGMGIWRGNEGRRMAGHD